MGSIVASVVAVVVGVVLAGATVVTAVNVAAPSFSAPGNAQDEPAEGPLPADAVIPYGEN